MAYATYDDLVMAFGQQEVDRLLDRDVDGVEDSGVLQDALDFAETHINGYLRERYAVPLVNPPRNLIGVACDIARYRLYQDQPTDLVQNRYDAGCFLLKDISRGIVQLDISSQQSPSSTEYSKPTPIFTRLQW